MHEIYDVLAVCLMVSAGVLFPIIICSDILSFLKLDLRDCLSVVGSRAEYVRKEIPPCVVPGSSLLKLYSPLTSFMDLQRVIYKEEKAAHLEAMGQNTR